MPLTACQLSSQTVGRLQACSKKLCSGGALATARLCLNDFSEPATWAAAPLLQSFLCKLWMICTSGSDFTRLGIAAGKEPLPGSRFFNRYFTQWACQYVLQSYTTESLRLVLPIRELQIAPGCRLPACLEVCPSLCPSVQALKPAGEALGIRLRQGFCWILPFVQQTEI